MHYSARDPEDLQYNDSTLPWSRAVNLSVDDFTRTLSEVTEAIQGRPLDRSLEAFLNERFPAGSPLFSTVREGIAAGVQAGWACHSGEGARRFGRIVEPAAVTHGFSIDVVDITELVGPHHRHPTGEIDMIMPLDAAATFDGRPEGWLVYPPDSAHRPTVRGGRAWILYLLPQGKIEFTGS